MTPDTGSRSGTLKHMWRTGKAALTLVNQRHIGLVSAGVAFFAMLAVFPALAAVVSIWGFFANPAAVSGLLDQAADYLPPDAHAIVAAQLDALIGANVSRVGWTTALTLGAALWSARAGVAAIVQGLNAVFGVPNRGGLWHALVSLGLTLSLVGAAITMLMAGIVLPVLLAFVPLGPFEAWGLTALRWSIAPLATLLGIGLLYRYGPNLPAPRPGLVSAGSAVAVVLWLAGSEAFALYLGNFANYNQVYGSIGAVVALLMWFYVSAYAVLLGAAVNAALRDTAQ